MNLSENLSAAASQAADMLTTLDALTDKAETLELENATLRAKLSNANDKIIALLTQSNERIEKEPHALKHIRSRARIMSEERQVSESVIWSHFLEACINCVIELDNDVNPEPYES